MNKKKRIHSNDTRGNMETEINVLFLVYLFACAVVVSVCVRIQLITLEPIFIRLVK